MPFKAYDDQDKFKPIVQQTIQDHESEKQSIVEKVADLLGVKKFGEGIGTAAYLNLTSEGRDLQKKAVEGDAAAAAGLKAVTDSAPSNKEILGSAALTAVGAFTGPIGRGAGVATRAAAGSTVRTGVKTAEKLYETTKTVGSRVADTKFGRVASDAITPIEEGVENILKKAQPEKFEKYVTQAKEATSDFSKITPLEIAGDEAMKVLGTLKTKAGEVGKIKSKIVESIGETSVGSIAHEARISLRNKSKEVLGAAFTKSGIKSAPGRVSSISDAADTKLLKIVDQKLAGLGKNASFRKVDDTIDYLQDLLFKRSSNTAVPVNTKVQSVVKGVISDLNKQLQTVGGKEFQQANVQYRNLKLVGDKLNKLLGKEGDRGGALMKRVFSPSDAGTKKLFAKIKEMTGVDLVEEATLAKFAMEKAGDARQASLLEEAIKGVSGGRSFIQGAAEKVIGKLQDPVGKARRIIRGRR